ncbi:MAG: GTP 3',8-cyclase MoaA [Candidatus Hodarchaeales archaeon]|jgi:cyclic pyranopterin phosphate synthase
MVSKTPQLIDRYGRAATNLRISVTDRCNLRCSYCLNQEEFSWFQLEELLTFEELKQISQIAAELGVTQLRITGGEPLTRPGICKFIAELKQIPGIDRVSMTTNGVLLNKYLDDLENAGLSSINISLDTLNSEKFFKITHRKKFETVFNNILKAKNSKIPVKVNCVALKGFNDMEIIDFVNFAIKYEITVRFIEFMPFKGNNWSSENLLSIKEIQNNISQHHSLIPEPLDHPSQTSRVYRIKDTQGHIGFISSVTESFCQWCNRLRLTADGNLRTCLNGKDETSLKPLLRHRISNDKLREVLIRSIEKKPKEHEDFLDKGYCSPCSSRDREMFRIGG